MERPTARLEAIGEKIRFLFSLRNSARDKALRLSRESIRHSSNSIRAAHRKELELAQELLTSARALVNEMVEAVTDQESLRYTGFVHDAQKEYAEASITLALVAGRPIPDPDELGVSYAAYLNGLGEAAGEMRRHLLDILRAGEVERCEELLQDMDDIYGLLVTIDFPDALTGGLRRTTDMVRGVLERTRGDLTLSLRQRDLERKLEAFTKDTLPAKKKPRNKDC